MIDGLKPYPAYKDSGVPWLGQVPEHWEVRRLGSLLQERRETNEGLRVTEVLSVLRERGVIPYAEKGNIGNKKSDDISRYKIVRPNDIVLNSMNVIIGSVGLSTFTGCISPVYYVLTRREAQDDPRYLNAYFQIRPFQQSLIRLGNGILAHRMRVPMELLKCEPFPRPPADEQTAIVRFLDYMDRRIRRVIHARQRQIKLLEEYRQALIHQAVTGQIDVRTGKPYPAYKDSGVPWLGQVPEHWEVSPPKRALRSESAGTAAIKNTAETKPLPGFVPAFSASGQDVWLPQPTHEGSALVLSAVGARCGKTFRADGRWAVVANTHVLWPRDGQNRDFWWYVTNNEDWWLRGGAAQPFVQVRATLDRPWVIPPLPEQTAIVDYLDAQTTKIDAAIATLRREIELLREYRERMIAGVVTGKVDVRELAARLPEEPPEDGSDGLDPLDEVETLASDGHNEEGIDLDTVA